MLGKGRGSAVVLLFERDLAVLVGPRGRSVVVRGRELLDDAVEVRVVDFSRAGREGVLCEFGYVDRLPNVQQRVVGVVVGGEEFLQAKVRKSAELEILTSEVAQRSGCYVSRWVWGQESPARLARTV